MEAPLLGWGGVRVVGGVLFVAALAALSDCFARFAVLGRGTPAPVAPTERLIVSGLYRHVRNPMYLALVGLIVGQGLFLGSGPVLLYGAAVWVGFGGFVVLYEEPTLRARYGQSYETYRASVRRWWPRLSAWRGPAP